MWTFHDLLSDLNLSAVDLDASDYIDFTYERDDGLCRSWPDHILISSHNCNKVSDVKVIHSAENFTDHIPLSFLMTKV